MGSNKIWHVTFNSHESGFTLVELLVAVALLGVLAVTLLTIFNPFLQFQKARDARRKSDLRQITTLLNEYYNDNQKFPPAGGCGCGVSDESCSVSSKDSSMWIPNLSTYATTLPVDPTNNLSNPWTAGNYSYSYGAVSCDGQTYDLTAQLENSSDTAACKIKGYKHDEGVIGKSGVGTPWCVSFGGTGSDQIYEYSPPF